MLKQRLLTAAVLIPFLIFGILVFTTPYFALMFAVIILLAGWEWGGVMKISSSGKRVAYAAVVGLSMAILWFFVSRVSSDWLALPVISLFWWLLALVWVLAYPKSTSRWSSPWLIFLIGLLVLIPSWSAVVSLHQFGEQGPYLVLYLIALVSFADTGAYFGGRKWGKHKLAPRVSPGKTWEGVVSALVVTGIFSLIAANLFSFSGNQLPAFIVLSLVTVCFSILGDLTESMFKRNAGLKDSGTILPGHGGVLDRMDGVTAAAPVFVVGLWLGDFGLGNFVISGGINL
jgi:phosphatidate cytidylyltransferase